MVQRITFLKVHPKFSLDTIKLSNCGRNLDSFIEYDDNDKHKTKCRYAI